ncbi:F-box associated interaction domain [Arabidopsis thaliana x Arabidopsis arenosa]|uniref:F-box associated interaction domain n=1 Tax=Arabidopsis thaliana x Arabidopsis arenosa TaxID=1240361 RepID=A0A8T1XTQ4_9BRAS|nr:F-box associated interaction domain [Arabidopsis thaliana x Arabidopsis arenosa]
MNIKCGAIQHHYPWLPTVCINGAIYYRATKDHGSTFFFVSFDVRSEKFNHVKAPKTLIDCKDSTLINYQGKLGFVSYEKSVEIWVMEDAKKQEWSKVIVDSSIGSCEIVFNNKMVICHDTVYVVYFDPKRKDPLRQVGIRGLRFWWKNAGLRFWKPVDDRLFTWAAVGLTIAIVVLLLKKFIRSSGYGAGFVDQS